MAFLPMLDLFWGKWFECYNIEFGTFDGTLVLYSKISNMKLELNFDVLYLPAEKINPCE